MPTTFVLLDQILFVFSSYLEQTLMSAFLKNIKMHHFQINQFNIPRGELHNAFTAEYEVFNFDILIWKEKKGWNINDIQYFSIIFLYMSSLEQEYNFSFLSIYLCMYRFLSIYLSLDWCIGAEMNSSSENRVRISVVRYFDLCAWTRDAGNFIIFFFFV